MVKAKKAAKKYLYFCYGSNLHVGQMGFRCPKAKLLGAAILKDYVLEFRGADGSAVANVRKVGGSLVVGGMWEITDKCLVALDIYEGYPTLYKRIMVDVEMGGEIYQAITYIMVRKYMIGTPSKRYFNVIREGFEDFNLEMSSFIDAVEMAVEASLERAAFFNEAKEISKKYAKKGA